jgi:hypothetical protein
MGLTFLVEACCSQCWVCLVSTVLGWSRQGARVEIVVASIEVFEKNGRARLLCGLFLDLHRLLTPTLFFVPYLLRFFPGVLRRFTPTLLPTPAPFLQIKTPLL